MPARAARLQPRGPRPARAPEPRGRRGRAPPSRRTGMTHPRPPPPRRAPRSRGLTRTQAPPALPPLLSHGQRNGHTRPGQPERPQPPDRRPRAPGPTRRQMATRRLLGPGAPSRVQQVPRNRLGAPLNALPREDGLTGPRRGAAGLSDPHSGVCHPWPPWLPANLSSTPPPCPWGHQ
eukprot:13770595-Alexandrium_andersonii.AAC.1